MSRLTLAAASSPNRDALLTSTAYTHRRLDHHPVLNLFVHGKLILSDIRHVEYYSTNLALYPLFGRSPSPPTRGTIFALLTQSSSVAC